MLRIGSWFLRKVYCFYKKLLNKIKFWLIFLVILGIIFGLWSNNLFCHMKRFIIFIKELLSFFFLYFFFFLFFMRIITAFYRQMFISFINSFFTKVAFITILYFFNSLLRNKFLAFNHIRHLIFILFNCMAPEKSDFCFEKNLFANFVKKY